jgi:uncharacterized surface protein with fasciclin (FAS1) repeats
MRATTRAPVDLMPAGIPLPSALPTEPALAPLPYRPLRLVGNGIIDIAAATGRLTTFGTAIRAAGLEDLFGEFGPLTVFAPTDDAFAKMPHAELAVLLAHSAELAKVLTYHVVRDIVKAPRAGSVTTATTIQGRRLRITGDQDGYWVNGAKVVKTDLRASNGVIHAIDTVLMPR